MMNIWLLFLLKVLMAYNFMVRYPFNELKQYALRVVRNAWKQALIVSVSIKTSPSQVRKFSELLFGDHHTT